MRRTAILRLGAIVLSFSLCACGGKTTIQSANTGKPQPGVQPPAPVANDAPRNTLSLSVPALAGLQPGAEFEATLSVLMTEPLFQASARVQFDPAVVEPVSAQRGAQLPADAVYLCSAEKPVSGTVPFAFTALPGQTAIPPGTLELTSIRFRVKQAITGDAGLRLLNDPRYLQLRSPDGRRLAFDLVNQAGATR